MQTDCDQSKKFKIFLRHIFLQYPQPPYLNDPQIQILIKIYFLSKSFFYHPGCDHRYVAYGLALKEETNLSILSTTASTIVLTSKPDIAISDSNKTSQTMADEQTTNYKDADSAVLVASVFLIYIVFFVCAVMLYKMLKINSF